MIGCVCELLVFEDYMLFCFPLFFDSSAFATCAELVLIDVTWPIWIHYSDPFSLKNSSTDMFICFKPFQPSALLSCEMEQKTCGMGEAIGGEKPGPSVKYVMAVELERVYYCWIFPEMLFPSKINCTLEQAQILCSPPLLLITKVSEAAWSGMHLNIFFCHLRGGACPQGLESCLPVSLSASSPQLQCSALSSRGSRSRLITQWRWGKKQRPIYLRQGKWTAPWRSGWMLWQRHLSQGRPLHKHKVMALTVSVGAPSSPSLATLDAHLSPWLPLCPPLPLLLWLFQQQEARWVHHHTAG